ncbi:MAG: AAA family ATPase [Planctomycetes bacterium]|nr:AAA family ATPase [Planctomycetota bacterium]
MLTRLRVDGFKNLNAVDVHFGPFTCIAGPNGVGKSNLFDAIAFLSALADKPLVEAALTVRGVETRRSDVRGIFRRSGEAIASEMHIEVEMLIPQQGEDFLGQEALAGTTYLKYCLSLQHRADPQAAGVGVLEIAHESLEHIKKQEARDALGFVHSPEWLKSVVIGKRGIPYISTDPGPNGQIITLRSDSAGAKGGGRPRSVLAATLPRTVLSSVQNAAEHRTVVLARQEMMSWTQLQLEPTALRKPDDFTSPRSLTASGGHLPATLYELAQREERVERGGSANLYAQVANRLSELVEGVSKLRIDVDEKRQLLSVVMTDRSRTDHFAGALSDGTLRFLALVVLEADRRGRSLICLEEPENGMHPSRIPAVIQLLADIAVDVSLPVGDDNPLRQVIINTHSPGVVRCVHDQSLLIAQASSSPTSLRPLGSLTLRPLTKTWRARVSPDLPTAARADVLAYLDGGESRALSGGYRPSGADCPRVAERAVAEGWLPFPSTQDAES